MMLKYPDEKKRMKPNQLFFTISIKIYDSLWHYEFLKIEWEQDVI